MAKAQVCGMSYSLWDKAQAEMQQTKQSVMYRGRILDSGGETIIYWAYVHLRPRSLLLLTDKLHIQQTFWETATVGQGESRKMREFAWMQDLDCERYSFS